MLAILGVVTPVFLVIGVGYAAVRFGWFDQRGVDPLIQFTIRFATPLLLFENMYRLDLSSAFEPGMLAAFYLGAFTSFTLGVLIARRVGRRPGEAVAVGFGGLFSNTVLLGLPIMISAYGAAATEPMFAIIALHAPSLYTIGVVAMEVSRQDGRGFWAALKNAGAAMARNALMLGVAGGLAANMLGLTLPAPVEQAVSLLASATLPTALFALGAALTRYQLSREIGLAAAIAGLSLLLHPAIAYLVAGPLLGLDAPFLRAAVVTAAMPAGLNVYVFAVMYARAEGAAASIVLLSTAASFVTIALWLAILGGTA